MREQAQRAYLVVAAAAIAVAAYRAPVHAFSGGITTDSFGVAGCNQCHSGGSVPTVRLQGSTLVTPGSMNVYTFEVDTIGSQNKAGLNVHATDGDLQLGGADSSGTQVVSPPSDPTDHQITHSGGPKSPVSGTVHFSFMWQAPVTPGVTTITAWGNAVNGDFTFNGDAAKSDELDVTVAAAPTGIDAYKCYQGKDLKTPKFQKQKCPAGVNTSDQFTTECVNLQKVKYVCTPVSVNGSALVDANAHLICYQIKGSNLSPRPKVEVNTQFQVSQFELKKPKLLCVPGTKVILP